MRHSFQGRSVLPCVRSGTACLASGDRSCRPSGVALWRSFRDSFLRFFHHGAREGRGSSGVPAVVPCLPAVVGIGTARPAVLRSFRRCVLPALPAVLPAVGAGSFGPSVGPACLAWVRRSCGPFFGGPSPRSGSFGGSFGSFIGTARCRFSPYIGRKTQLDPAQPLDRSGFEPVFAPVLFVGRFFFGSFRAGSGRFYLKTRPKSKFFLSPKSPDTQGFEAFR